MATNQVVHEKPETSTPSTIDVCVSELNDARERYAKTSIGDRIALAEACLKGIADEAHTWVDAAARAKGGPDNRALRSEEVLAGPVSALRYLRLIINSLRDLEKTGTVQLPGKIEQGPHGKLHVQVVPAKGLYDSLAFAGMKVSAWMQEGITRDNLKDHIATHYRKGQSGTPRISLVLGAGNVSSIPVTDAFTKLFQEGSVVLLKMNPVNEYLGPIFERALAPLIEPGYLRVIYGGADVGAAAVSHEVVDEVHITGSIHSHDHIVWGPAGEERERRKQENDPVLKKPISSELGNVSPWIMVPGPYSKKQLDFQAENIASSVINNASFNCVATKVLLTWKRWPDRELFLDKLQSVLDVVPPRCAYYPGAHDRFRRFAGKDPGTSPGEHLPWTLLRGVTPEEAPHLYEEESFTCVFVELPLDAETEEDFLRIATDFTNERLWGTLSCALTVHPGFRRRNGNEDLFQSCLENLRYGAIGINHWPAMVYAMMSATWGGYPGATLEDAQSGIGWVHNTYMLDGVEKSVLEGPLTMAPKPLWFPTQENTEPVVWKLFELYRQPSFGKLLGLLGAAGKNAILG